MKQVIGTIVHRRWYYNHYAARTSATGYRTAPPSSAGPRALATSISVISVSLSLYIYIYIYT